MRTSPRRTRRHLASATALLAASTTLVLSSPVTAGAAGSGVSAATAGRYLVALEGTQTGAGFDALGSATQVRALLSSVGATVATDLGDQIGVLVVRSASPAVVDTLAASPLVDEAGADWSWKGLPDASAVTPMRAPGGGDAPEQTADPLEPLQWDMAQIHAPEAHDRQAGERAVDVGILDSGIDGRHPDFLLDGAGSNVDCARGHNSVAFLPTGPGAGTPDPCTDNQFHGTHVAGTVAAQANQVGVVGVAPNVTLVPVKVCDASGFCYASAVVDGITYAGDQQLDVINMSFFVDNDEFQESTEFKCSSDPTQRTFRKAVERAIQYARNQGVTPVAALGNSDQDLAHPVGEDGQPISNECEVVPAETEGVIGTASLGRDSEKASYSNYGTGATDVAAPGGNGSTGDCTTTILSTLPAGGYGCIQGTSMASPHAAGVAALVVSQLGTLGRDGDVKLSPTTVESVLQGSAVDIGLAGYDECFGNGRIDAARAVAGETAAASDPSAPLCPEYAE
jgi:subtilisin family serine protease